MTQTWQGSGYSYLDSQLRVVSRNSINHGSGGTGERGPCLDEEAGSGAGLAGLPRAPPSPSHSSYKLTI